MEGFNQETSLQQLELNGSAVFSTSSGSSRENELDILHLFGKEKLENIQKSLSKATGLAFVTVDYRGEPITESTSFSSFCRMARNDGQLSLRCKSSDAFGSIQAAVMQKPRSMRPPGSSDSYRGERALSGRLYRRAGSMQRRAGGYQPAGKGNGAGSYRRDYREK